MLKSNQSAKIQDREEGNMTRCIASVISSYSINNWLWLSSSWKGGNLEISRWFLVDFIEIFIVNSGSIWIRQSHAEGKQAELRMMYVVGLAFK